MKVVDPQTERESRERMDSSEKERLRVLMLPWLAHGHISPFVELAKKLSRRNFDIYICSTPANLSSIKNRVTENYSLHIHLVELHLPADELPPHYHTTNGLPLHLQPILQKALKKAKSNFSNLLKTLQPHLLVVDLILQWPQSVASLHNIPVVSFTIFSAAALSFYFHSALRPGIDFPFPAIRLTDYELSSIAPKNHESAEKDPDDDVPNDDQVIVLVNSSRVIDGKYMDYYCELMRKWEIIPIGALVQDSNIGGDGGGGGGDNELIEWLGRKDEFSCVLVSFGSEYFLKREEIEEIAYGLEMSNVNFIWVVRAPKGEEMSVKESLPQGYVERVKERGKIVEKWAPQAKILRHSSIGGFVSHSGWNSVLESVEFGVPIIAIPMHLDQPLNAKLVVELGVGVEVVRDGNGGLQREEISQVIKDVVIGRKGEILRRRVEEVKESVRSRSNEEMEEVVEKLTQLCGKRK